MKFNLNIKRSGIIAVTAALIYLSSLTGCQPSPVQTSSVGYSTFDSNTAEPSVDFPDNSGDSDPFSNGKNSAPSSASDSTSDGSSDQTSSTESSSSGTNESDDSTVSAVVDSGSETNSSSVESTSTSSVPAPSSSSAPSSTQKPPASSTVVDPKPPAEVVIPDFPVPTSSGEQIFSCSGGWINYSNASDGYISAMYTGTKLRAKLIVIANGEEYPFDLSVGGVIQYFPLSMGNGTYTVVLYEQIEGISYATLMRNQFEVSITNPRSPFMYTNRYVKYDKNSKCVYKAAELCAGKTDNISKIAAIFGWITDNVKYDNQLAATAPKTYCPDPDTTYSKKTGICYDYASLMAAMLRSQGIPTRLVIGYAGDLRHAWNEIYTEQTGWITPELLLRNNGYNTVDATFYAGSSNKAAIAAYISNPSNYSAVYYY